MKSLNEVNELVCFILGMFQFQHPSLQLSAQIFVQLIPPLMDLTPKARICCFEAYIMYFLSHCVGWTQLDAESLIVHHCKQFSKEINKICSYFYGIPVVWSFHTIYSFVIICLHVLCMSSFISLLLIECYQV